MNPPRRAPVLLIAGLASGQGKTTVTAALAAAVRRAGHRVQVFKAGPDFIDPMVLARASGQPVFNLDDRMVGLAESRARVAAASQANELVLIEGVMGLYDGPPSAADLACGLGVPVAVLVDAGAMAQTFGAVVLGLAEYGARQGRPLQVLGAIANRVASPGHGRMLAESLPPGLPLLAALPRLDHTLPERHLGLASEALAEVDAAIHAMADAIEPAMLAQLLALPGWAGEAEPLPAPPLLLAGRQIAVAQDAAFRFLYPANLAALQAMGATLLPFSPLADEPVPAAADALWLPGGYPELHAAELAAATRWTASVQAFHAAGRPIWAECGGMMALAQSLSLSDGARHAMAGLLPGAVAMQTRLAGLGVQQLALAGHAPLRGHTFHFSTLDTPVPAHAQCERLGGGAGEALWQHGSLRASYFHAYFPSSPSATAALFSPAPLP